MATLLVHPLGYLLTIVLTAVVVWFLARRRGGLVRPKGPWSHVQTAIGELQGPMLLGLSLAGVTLVATALSESALARAVLAFLSAAILAALGIVASYHASSIAAQDQLVVFGMQATRELEVLRQNMLRRVANDRSPSMMTVKEWCEAVEAAKMAWMEVSSAPTDARARAQTAIDALDRNYAAALGAARGAEARAELRSARDEQVRVLEQMSPLPVRVPTEFTCPYCNSGNRASILTTPGTAGTLRCGSCQRILVLRREGAGRVAVHVRWGKGLPVHPDTLLPGMKIVAEVFRLAPNEQLPSFDAFKERTKESLLAAGLAGNVQERLYDVLWNLKAFKLLGRGVGVGLVVHADELLDFVETRLYRRLDGPLNPEAFCRQLYGENTERLPAIKRLLAERVGPTTPPDVRPPGP